MQVPSRKSWDNKKRKQYRCYVLGKNNNHLNFIVYIVKLKIAIEIILRLVAIFQSDTFIWDIPHFTNPYNDEIIRCVKAKMDLQRSYFYSRGQSYYRRKRGFVTSIFPQR